MEDVFMFNDIHIQRRVSIWFKRVGLSATIKGMTIWHYHHDLFFNYFHWVTSQPKRVRDHHKILEWRLMRVSFLYKHREHYAWTISDLPWDSKRQHHLLLRKTKSETIFGIISPKLLMPYTPLAAARDTSGNKETASSRDNLLTGWDD